MAKVYDINEILLLDTLSKLRRTLRRKDTIQCESVFVHSIKNILDNNRIVYQFSEGNSRNTFSVISVSQN